MSDSDSSSDESVGDSIEVQLSNLDKQDYDGHIRIIKKFRFYFWMESSYITHYNYNMFMHTFSRYELKLMLGGANRLVSSYCHDELLIAMIFKLVLRQFTKIYKTF